MLGELIARIDRPGIAEAALLEAGDLVLLAAVTEAAAQLSLSTGDFAALALRRFVERAGDDDWLQLAGTMGRTEEPGLAALRAILNHAVADAREASASTPNVEHHWPERAGSFLP